jgi:hypothetical protein
MHVRCSYSYRYLFGSYARLWRGKQTGSRTNQRRRVQEKPVSIFRRLGITYTPLYHLLVESEHVEPGVHTAPPRKGLRSCDIWHLAHMPSEDPVRGIGTRAGSLGSLFCL